MSLQDRLTAGDASHLLHVGALLSLVPASSSVGSKYNLPIFLFGAIAHELPSTNLLRSFLILLLFSVIDDLYILLRGLGLSTTIFSLLVLLIKAPVFFTSLNKLQERGGNLDMQIPGAGALNLGGAQAPGWSMPGGWGGQGQTQQGQPQQQPQQPYQPHQAQHPAAPGSFPSAGGFRLGGDEESGEADNAPPPTGRGGYQTIN